MLLRLIKNINFPKRSFSAKVAHSEQAPHTPVMLNEVLKYLDPSDDKIFIDMTFGAGGHSTELLKSAPNIKVFGLDRDLVACNYAKNLANTFSERLVPLHGKFSELPSLLTKHNIKPGSIDGILFDFGCSSMQFDQAERGFSISKNGPLDMRMDNSVDSTDPTAAKVLATLQEEDLAKIFRIYGEEKQSKKIARAIIEARHSGVFLQTTQDLSNLVTATCGSDHRQDKLQRHAHSATKVFQALRIFINNEVNEINYAMIVAHYYLKMNGRMVTLTFHSLEDKIVKRHIHGNVIDNAINPQSLKYTDMSKYYNQEDMANLMEPVWKQLNKHVLTPSEEEIIINPRSRSAKLRAAVKIK
jgi:receptor-type tyrosine-protein phosphatase gamma